MKCAAMQRDGTIDDGPPTDTESLTRLNGVIDPIAGNGGMLAAPVAFLFSLFLGSLIATQLHQAFRPQTAPVDEFNGLISLHFPEVVAPLAVSVLIGAVGGWVGERLVPAGRWEVPPRR